MKQTSLISEITDLLVQFSKEVSDKGKLKLTDINIISEDVLVPILSIAYETNLINLNEKKSNYPGIDLATDEHITYGSENKKIAFQITSTNNIAKIKKTLNEYVKGNFYEKFDELFIYNLIEKQNNYQAATIKEIERIVDGKFVFDLGKNIIDRTDLEKKIKTLTPITKIETICKLLKDQFIYRKKSLLSFEIWESEGKIGYGFSNLLSSIDQTTFNTLVQEGISNEAKNLLQLVLYNFNNDFSNNYNNNQKDKFSNLGFNTYLKAGLTQALESFQVIKEEINGVLDKDLLSIKLSDSFEKLNSTIDESDYPLINDSINHPAIKFIKNTTLQVFTTFNVHEDLKDIFTGDFNEKIRNRIIETFGKEDYSIHLERTKDKWIRENEKELLIYMKNLSKLGFVDGEELEYQETFGTWQDIRNYGYIDENKNDRKTYKSDQGILSKINANEEGLKTVETLIDEYFKNYSGKQEGFLNNILFLIADFGKGKTCFLHYFASKLAQRYIKTKDGLFPVYINLNEYDNYSNSPSLGVIANYLAKKFKIDIKDDYFKTKNYIFLVDSLDECGELSETHINNVVKDIVEIQNLDCINQRNNRLIIASRPIATGLKEQITKYKPFPIKIEEKEKTEFTENFISVYGFKKNQFNEYIEFALKKFLSTNQHRTSEFTGFSKTILTKIEKAETINLYEELLGKVLKQSELKRPIFAYMIYKLIISNTDFIDFGKVGVYISFLNQLTRDAKHKDDSSFKVSLKDEFIYRNVLHASALLWQYKRQSGEQTALTKADICRTIEEREIDKDDRTILTQFNDIESIHFLSHSYLGEKENTLHFQHQSFAEILLAEYYLKVIIKYAIEESTGVEDARIRLSVGIPTDQTIEFFKGLVTLLKDCVVGDVNNPNIIAKRQLLLPMLASMAINKHNKKLYSTRLNATWFEKYEDSIFRENTINIEMLKDFPVTPQILLKIEKLCYNIIDSKQRYLLTDSSIHTVLFKNELIGLNMIKELNFDIDKWFALIVGNIICNNEKDKIFYNSKIEAKVLFDIIKNWNVNFGNIPFWAYDLFKGIDMRENETPLHISNISAMSVNFSYSYFRKLVIKNSELNSCCFNYSVFDFFNLIESDIRYASFDDIIINYKSNDVGIVDFNRIVGEDYEFGSGFEGRFCLIFCFIAQGVLFPAKLNFFLKRTYSGLVNQGHDICVLNTAYASSKSIFEELLKPLKGIFNAIILKGGNAEFILSAFEFVSYNQKRKEVKKRNSHFEKFIYKMEEDLKLKK